MRLPIAHNLPKDEVRRRLAGKAHEIANFVPGGMAEATSSWPSEDVMTLNVRAMGASVDGRVLIEDHQVVFEIDLPPSLGFVEPMIRGAMEAKGTKLLSNDAPPSGGAR